MITSNSIDDIHKGMKYGIWTAHKKINEKILEI